MKRTTFPCKSFKEYKAVYAPKCNCQPCWDKWVDKIFIGLGVLDSKLYRRMTRFK